MDGGLRSSFKRVLIISALLSDMAYLPMADIDGWKGIEAGTS
jgi:hypothetical protein